MRCLLAVAGILAVLGFPPASLGDWPPVVDAKIAQAKRAVKAIDMAAIKRAVDTDERVLIVDVREPDEYAAGHIPRAVNIPRGVLEFRIWKYVGYPDRTNTAARIYLYCRSGARCALAARTLGELGFTNVYAAVGMKFDDWVAAGYPVE